MCPAPPSAGSWPITLIATRDLRVADLTGYGLRQLRATRAEIIDSDPRSYPHTARWAHGMHAHREHLDGIQWVSRQYDTALALILFDDRVQETELDIAPAAIPMPLPSVPVSTTCRTWPTRPTSPSPETHCSAARSCVRAGHRLCLCLCQLECSQWVVSCR